MGADLYLPGVLNACHQRYRYAAQLIEEILALSQGDVHEAAQQESQRLKEALLLHAQQVGAMAPPLFDLVTEIADLAHGELTVWTAALAEQIATLLAPTDASAMRKAEAAPAEAVRLARMLADLLRHRPEAAIRHGAFLLATFLQEPDAFLPKAGTLTPLFQSARLCLQDVLADEPRSAVTFLLRFRLLPALERACADQSRCLEELARALEPLGPATTASSPDEATFTAGQTLATFSSLASRLRETTETLRRQVFTLLQASTWEVETLAASLVEALSQVQGLWQERQALQPALEEATETLGALLLRTLPSLQDTLEHAAAMPEEASPLQRTVGLLLRHQFIWQGVMHLLVQSADVLQQTLMGERLPALREVCRTLVMAVMPGAAPSETEMEAGSSLAARLRPFVANTVPLTTGVTMVPATPMDACFVQIMTSIQHQEQGNPLRIWAQQALAEEPMTSSPSGILLRYWLLLQDEPRLWAELLAARLHETLPAAVQGTTQECQVRALLEHCQGLLDENPSQRLRTLLTYLCSQLPSSSPLLPPATRLLALAQGQTHEPLAEKLTALARMGQEAQEWPEEQRQDFCGLVDLARGVLEVPARQHLPLVTRALMQEWQQERLDAWETGGEQVQQELHHLFERLSTLPEPGPQPPVADPRRIADWRLHLLRSLIALQQRPVSTAQEEAPERGAEDASPDAPGHAPSVLEPLLLMLQRMVTAWCFPPEGYFRDPYNDTNTLWIAAGVFWPEVAARLADPVETPDPRWQDWLPPEQEGLAQIPLARIDDLRELLRESELRLPSRAHLEHWGAQTIRLEETGPYGLEAWYAFFARRKEQLLAFLNEAIAREEPILCSL